MPDLTDRLRAAGYRVGAELGSGMESVVYALVDQPDRVLKVWHRREPDDLARLQRFTAALERAGLAVPFPRVHRLVDLDDQQVTVETHVHGTPLRDGGPTGPITDQQIEIVIAALTALAAVRPVPDLALLPPLPGEEPFDGSVGFAESLATLVERRYRRFVPALSRRLPDIERLVAGTLTAIRTIERRPPAIIHGDLVPPNLMINSERELSGILDFGFLTLVGDPAFDAAVTASIYDMYGEHGRRSESALDAAIVGRFGYPPRTLAIYRAAYAIITANAFSADGSDGHFDWCAQMLERADVRSAILG